MWRSGSSFAKSLMQQSKSCPGSVFCATGICKPSSRNLHGFTNRCMGLAVVSSFQHRNFPDRFSDRHRNVRHCHQQKQESQEYIYGNLFVPVNDPVKGKLVYTGNLAANMRALKIFSLGTSFVTLCFQPFIFALDESTVLKATMLGILGFFMLLNPVLIHMLVKKYIIYMYYNKDTDTFTATTLTFFLKRKDLVFKAEDVTQTTSASMFTFMYVNGKPLFLDPSQFKDMAAYVHMMGYDKPLDLSSLEDTDSVMKTSKIIRDKYKAIKVPEDFNSSIENSADGSGTKQMTSKSESREQKNLSDTQTEEKVKDQSRY